MRSDSQLFPEPEFPITSVLVRSMASKRNHSQDMLRGLSQSETCSIASSRFSSTLKLSLTTWQLGHLTIG